MEFFHNQVLHDKVKAEIPLSFDDEVTRAIHGSGKVSLKLYVEALCPGCRIFIHLVSLLMQNEEFHGMVDLEVVPFGNGAQLADGTLQCQHGEEECLGNKIFACAQKHYSDVDQFLPAVGCLAKSDDEPGIAAPGCCEKNGLSYDVIRQCAYGREGEELLHQAAKATLELDPPHQWSPWITLNGEPLLHNAWDLVPAVCKKYGGIRGELCSSVRGSKMLSLQRDQDFSVCVPGDKTLRAMP